MTPLTRRIASSSAALLCALAIAIAPATQAYVTDATVPLGAGCPQPNRWSLSLGTPLQRQWSTALPTTHAIVTSAINGTAAQLNEVEQAIVDSFGAWAGVSGTTFNSASHPGVVAPLARVAVANACSNDQGSNVDGLNTICFNQASAAFAPGVLAFTRVITANAPGVSAGTSGPAAFAGQILDADTLFRPDGQVTFATPLALASSPGSYDLESVLIHELGHWLGLDHSGVWRAILFPFAPPPGKFLGARPTAQIPDGPLADDDRTGIRFLYPDPADAINVGAIRGRVLPANPFALANTPPPSAASAVTGIVGAHVVAVDAQTGAVMAGALSGWSCNGSTGAVQFDGSYDIERLPIGRDYVIYAEPLTGVATPANFSGALGDVCSASGANPCTAPAANTNFNPRLRPAP